MQRRPPFLSSTLVTTQFTPPCDTASPFCAIHPETGSRCGRGSERPLGGPWGLVLVRRHVRRYGRARDPLDQRFCAPLKRRRPLASPRAISSAGARSEPDKDGQSEGWLDLGVSGRSGVESHLHEQASSGERAERSSQKSRVGARTVGVASGAGRRSHATSGGDARSARAAPGRAGRAASAATEILRASAVHSS